MPQCGFCSTSITRTKAGVSCEICKTQFHSGCITKSVDLLNLFDAIPGLSWKCKDCVINCISLDQSGINKLLETKLDEALSSMNNQLERFKSEIAKVSKETQSPNNQVKYSDVVRNKTQPAVIINPKDTSQSYSQTKSEIMRYVDPTSSDIQLSRVKTVKDGGILIGCSNKNGHEKLKEVIQQNLANTYEVREVSGISPRIRLVGMSEQYTEDDLHNLVLRCNSGMFYEDSECKIIKMMPTKKNEEVFQAIIQVDKISYSKILSAGNLFVGYDSCTVYDAIEIYRCFNCNEYHHSSRNCQKAISCPICSGNHELKSCKSQFRKCTNCCILKNKLGNDIDVDHAVWEREKCTVYKKAVEKLKHDLLSI